MPTLLARQLLAATPILLVLLLMGSSAQTPEPAGPNLLRLEGTDPASGIHYLKLILVLPPEGAAAADADPGALPRFTMECREKSGKRSLHWLVRFTGSPDFAFQPPFLSTPEHPYPPANPNVQLRMRFEGYKKSQEFKRQWEQLPTGELIYRNSGLDSANMEDPSYFLTWLTSLPNLRIGYIKPVSNQPAELVFPTQPLLALLRKIDLCQP